MVKLTEVEDEHFSEKTATTKDDGLLADDDEDYTDTGMICPLILTQYHTFFHQPMAFLSPQRIKN